MEVRDGLKICIYGRVKVEARGEHRLEMCRNREREKPMGNILKRRGGKSTKYTHSDPDVHFFRKSELNLLAWEPLESTVCFLKSKTLCALEIHF